jgi:hypothetical protein
LLAALAVTVTACGSSSSGSDAGGSTAAGSTAPEQSRAQAADGPAGGAVSALDGSGAPAGQEVQQRAVISTGRVQLTSGDVGAARDRVDAVLDRERGRIADEDTDTDDRGTVTSAHLVLRVPSAAFDETMTALASVATLRSSTRKAEDVTTQVIDTDARIAAERAGVRRLRDLVSRAADLRALLAVERELTARQGELDSLLQQRAYLADRTSLATITVDITRHVAPTPVKQSAGGFIGGLHHGWHAFVAVVVGVLVAVGAVLPFAVAAAVLGLPVWLLTRRFRRPRHPEVPPAEPAS